MTAESNGDRLVTAGRVGGVGIAPVHLHRAPSGSDFAVRARGSIGPDGIGVTTAELFDRDGFIGTSAQTLLVQRR